MQSPNHQPNPTHNTALKQLVIQPLLSILILALTTILIGCGPSWSYYKLARGTGRYSDRAAPRTIYVGEKKQAAWVMFVERHHPAADFLYGSFGSRMLVFEPPLWSTKSVNRLMDDTPPWQCLWSEGYPINNLREMAYLAFPRKSYPDLFIIRRNADDSGWEKVIDEAKLLIVEKEVEIPVWVISIKPLVFAVGENLPDCPYGFEKRLLQSCIFAPRTEDFDCNIISIAAFDGAYPDQWDSEARLAAKKEFRHLTIENPLTLGDLLNQPEIWQNLLE